MRILKKFSIISKKLKKKRLEMKKMQQIRENNEKISKQN